MQYIPRELERKFIRMNGFFKAILVTGARQVGKTTMLRHLAEGGNRTYISLDDFSARDLAQRDPKLFFQTYKPPILIDEIQKAPELFEQMKLLCDESEETGLFWLTGSQQYRMMRHAGETLAGRIEILELYSFSQREKAGIVFDDELDFTLESLQARQRLLPKNDIHTVFRHIWEGGMPQLLGADEELRSEYLNSYINTYLMRDAADEGGITDTVRFGRFLKCCAALTAEPVYLLQPYANNALKRLSKTPKLYFCDTGLCAFLSMWLTADALEAGAASGHFYENYVVMELVRNYAYSRSKANLTFYRDSNAKEIDVFIEENNQIHPLEIKKSAAPNYRTVKNYTVLDKAALNRGMGGIICMADAPIPIDEKNLIIPSNLI